MKFSCFIIDDEPLAIEVLENHIERVNWLELRGSFTNGFEALDQFHRHQPALLFLDIDMPEMDGLQFMRSLRKPPAIIFTTAHRNYAFEGFEMDIVDFLLKPIPFDRFYQSLQKFLLRSEKTEKASSDHDPASTALFLSDGSRMLRIEPNKILYMEGMKDYIKVHLENGEVVVKSTMKAMEEMLNDDFLRIHKSYIVAMSKVQSIDNSSVEIEGKEIPIGRSYRSLLQKFLKERSKLLK